MEVSTREEISGILNRFHDQVGHPGINSTYSALQQRFTWKGMCAEVTDYVSFLEIVIYISYILKLNDFLFVCLFIYPN